MLTSAQIKFIFKHLRRPENDKRISEVAGIIADKFKASGDLIEPLIVRETALLMNLGMK